MTGWTNAIRLRLAGARQLGILIEELHEGTHAQSEHRFVALLREAGITGWRANHPVRITGRRYLLDAAFPGAWLAVEIDGRAHYSSAAAFQTTVAGRTTWWQPGGPSCGSPGTTS